MNRIDPTSACFDDFSYLDLDPEVEEAKRDPVIGSEKIGPDQNHFPKS